MFKNYLKVFFRNTFKNPGYSTINILGLAIGIASSLVAFLYINNELSINKGFKDYDTIYRIGAGLHSTTLNDSMPNTVYGVAPALIEQVPEVEAATRIVRWYGSELIKIGQQFYPETNILIADSAFFDVFSFKLLQGDRKAFMKSPRQIAISKSFAIKVFGDKDPMNEVIEYDDRILEIAWVIDDSEKTMIKFDIINSFSYHKDLISWLMLDVHTFFKLKVPITPFVEKKIRMVSDKVLLDAVGQWSETVSSPIQAFKDVYLYSNLGREIGKRGSVKTLYLFSFLAFIILLIAIINYVNLLTSHSEKRNKEVGIRKVVGAFKSKLKVQFLMESVFLTFISLLIGFVITEFFLYMVNGNLNMQLTLFGQSNWLIYVVYIVIAILIGVLSGIYPAFIMSAYNPIKVIKGIVSSGANTNLLKILLVFIQFTISTSLLIAIFIFYSQINFLKEKDLGFDKENLVVLSECTSKLNNSYESIRNKLISHPRIQNVAGSQSIPGWGRSGQTIRKLTDDPKSELGCAENRVLDHYTETMGIEIIKGRSFDPNLDDNRSVIINETAARELKLDDPIGVEVMTNRESVIIGVAKDYHYYGTTESLTPLYLSNYRETFNNISVRIAPEDRQNTLRYIKQVIMEHDPDYFWNYFFIDDMFENQYKVEERLFKMIFWGSGIALILSVLGLFALTSYNVSRKFKEIGIRKTFGASVNSIVSKLNKDIVRWVLLTNIISWPAAYLAMNNWLQNYPYRVDINWMYFILASAISLIIAIITISFQAFKAARMNPVDAIRYE
ncbi:MAG: ABC transporter permease [Bacteroidales bacterium]|nr:ABC transporter permease [Bacteroidales bacterium]